jgi:hypothetical protein
LRELRLALLIFAAVFVCAGLSYFLVMHAEGNVSISANNQDWGGFGSYIGGILAPAASLLAGYLVYKSFSSNAYQQKLILARESISRLDIVLEKKLEAPFSNTCFGEMYCGRPLKGIIYALSNNEITGTEISNKALLSLLHNIAILANSINHYIELLEGLPTSEKDSNWLGELERGYWIEKYSAICSRMVQIIGQDAFENKVSKEQLRSFKLVLGGGYGL